jgi:SAM-dependent methyltransferase
MAKTNLDPRELRAALLRRLPQRLSASGELKLPAVPGLRDEYVARLARIFARYGRPLNATQTASLGELLDRKLKDGFKASPYASILVRYETDPPPKTTLSYKVAVRVSTMADQYAEWVAERKPPLFGSHPDTKVMDLAASLGDAKDAPVLDIGAGTGRNTLPLARAGHPTDAVEFSPDLARILKADIESSGLPVRVWEGDVLDSSLDLPTEHYRLVIACEVVSHFRSVAEVRALFERVKALLVPGGLFAFSVFLPTAGYKPDTLSRELSEIFWCSLYTRDEMASSAGGLGFDRISDESVFEYEKSRLPESAWPPTGWFAEWTQGIDMFDLPAGKAPIDMRWLVYRRK